MKFIKNVLYIYPIVKQLTETEKKFKFSIIFQLKKKFTCESVKLSEHVVVDNHFEICEKLWDEEIINIILSTGPENITNSEDDSESDDDIHNVIKSANEK